MGLRFVSRAGATDIAVAAKRARRGTSTGVLLVLGALVLGATAAAADQPGTVTEYPIPSKPAGPQGLAPGPDGAEWFVELDTGQIGRMTPFGAFTEFPTPGGSAAFLRDITEGPMAPCGSPTAGRASMTTATTW